MKFVTLLGRIILGGYFLMSGLNHFLQAQQMSGYAASKGVPMPTIAVLVAGALIVAGGALVLLGYKVRVGAWLIIAFLVPVTFMMHNFWAVAPEMKQAEMINFMKNMGLIGATLMIAGVRSWPLGLEKSGTAEPVAAL